MTLAGFGPSSWQVESGQRVGAFVLGMGVNQVLAIVQSMGCLEKGGMFSFDDRRLFDVDLSLRLPPLGLQLCFDSFRQDLRVICVNLKLDTQESAAGLDNSNRLVPGSDCSIASVLPLTYGGRPFAGKQNSTLREIENMIGPTYLGDFVSEHGQACYILRYPGLAFEFPLPMDIFADLVERRQHPMELPAKGGIEQTPPVASRMWVYAKASNSLTSPASTWLEEPMAVVVRPGVGLELNGKVLRFGAMPQDVFSDFGPPDQACVKTMDSVRIHSVSTANLCVSGPDYYYNYFQFGFDVLFDGCSHIVKKMVLHTNPPTHESFSRYSRCFYRIPIAPPSCDSKSNIEIQAAIGTELECDMPEFTLGEAFHDDVALHINDTEMGPPVAPCLQPDVIHAMQPPPQEQNFSRFALPFTDDWRTRLESKLADRGVASQENRCQVEIYDCEGEVVKVLCEDVDLLPDRFPLSVAYPMVPQSAELVDETENTEEVSTGARRMTKRERKSARKKGSRQDGTARAPAGSPLMQGDTSPDLSSPSFSSPSPSPLLAQLSSMGQTSPISPCIACTGDDLDLLDDLPPPAVPIDSVVEVPAPKQDGNHTHPSLSRDDSDSPSDLQHLSAVDSNGTENWNSGTRVIDQNVSTVTAALVTSEAFEVPQRVADSPRMLKTLAEGGFVGVEWEWSEIQELLSRLGICCRKPLVVDKGSQNPFGSTHFYAIPGLVFEVMHNGFVASLTIFSVPPAEIQCDRLMRRDFVYNVYA